MLTVTLVESPPVRIACDPIAVVSSDAIAARVVGVVEIEKQRGELVSAETSDHVGAAKPSTERLGDGAEDIVAGTVAERVVDELEPVDVEHEERGTPVGLARKPLELVRQLFVEAAAVEEAGERVVARQPFQLLVGVPALGDVLDLRDEVKWLARAVADERDGECGPHDGVVGPEVSLLQLVGGDLAGDEVSICSAPALQIVGMRDVVECSRQQLGLAPTRACRRASC